MEKTKTGEATPRRRTHTHTLLEPITTASGEEITSVVVRRPKGGELRKIAKMYEEDAGLASYTMIAWLTGLTVEYVDEMDGEDVEALSEIVENFMPKRRTTAA